MTRKWEKISDYKHRVIICSMEDVVVLNGTMSLKRNDIYHCWAKILPNNSSMFGRSGYAIKEPEESLTHAITIRQRRDLDYSSSAWVYEERLQSPPRWFKILAIRYPKEDGQLALFDCRIFERGQNVTQPATKDDQTKPNLGAIPIPVGVRL